MLGFVAEKEEGTNGNEIRYSRLATFLEFCKGMKVLGKPPSFATVTRDVYPADTPPLTLPQALVIARSLASAAAHLHARGIAHGDLYAHNILVDRALLGPQGVAGKDLETLETGGGVKLGDLGAAFAYEKGGPTGSGIERLEVRAWACLVEELLAMVPPNLTTGDVGDTLRRLSVSCRGEDVPETRPSFSEIYKTLMTLAK